MLREVSEDWNEVWNTSRRLAYMSRDIELQREAIERLEGFEDRLLRLKRRAQEEQNEDGANYLLAVSTMIRALRSELSMFVALKEDRPGEAWNHLIDSQNAAAAALRAHEVVSDLEEYAERLLLHEGNLFPPQLFLSPTMTVGYSECSICSTPYGDCGHIAGKAYMGEFCTRTITEVTEVSEISLVWEPKDKRRRIISVSDDEGRKRDFLSWRLHNADEPG